MNDRVKCLSCARGNKENCFYHLKDFKKLIPKDASFNDAIRYVCPSCGAWGNITSATGDMMFHVNHSNLDDFCLEPARMPDLSKFRTVPELPNIPNPFSTEFDV